ncbi:hypothetical protein CGZ98_06110 [Enemella evansiae]|uniref:hypothetical protein n=1 Tax=Enemella evansiae TaxID=2016499 RepID=UPI000B970A89|nr:hypothetical protein [Enemella evansiae]OYO13116.1 hypothetical protein CGZ98_06110 [Enemella evansiae]
MKDINSDALAHAVVDARSELAELYAEAISRGMEPLTRGGHQYLLLLDQLNPSRLLTYALGDDGQLYRAPVAERQDPLIEAGEFLAHYPRGWLAVGPDGELLSRYNGAETRIRKKVRTDLIHARVAAARVEVAEAYRRRRLEPNSS